MMGAMNTSMLMGALGLVVAALALGSPQEAEWEWPASQAEVETSALRAHLGFLASDELRGREAFTPEALKVAHYLEGALQHAGVPEVLLQPVPFERTTYSQAPELVLVDGEGHEHELVYGAQFSLSSRPVGRAGASLEVVHARAEKEWEGEPSSERAVLFHGSAREWRAFRNEAQDQGWGLLLHHQGARKERGAKEAPRDRVTPAWGTQSQEPAGTDAAKLYGDHTAWIDSVRSLRFDAHVSVVPHTEYNVVGRIPGVGNPQQPKLGEQAIVVSAHYDHIGVQPGGKPEQDTIRNGADDDASGVAALLEIAEAVAHGPAPARSVVFLLACAEEKGILGTKYYVHAPTVPLETIVCNLNLEMLGRPDELVGGAGKLWLTGWERSNLGPGLEAQGLAVVPDPRPEMSFFTRSDNIVFVEVGVVAQTLSSYNMHSDYHQVGDEVERIDFDHLTQCTRAALQATQALAQGSLHPAWNEGEPRGFLPKDK